MFGDWCEAKYFREESLRTFIIVGEFYYKQNGQLSDRFALKILEGFKDLLDSARREALEQVFNGYFLESQNASIMLSLTK